MQLHEERGCFVEKTHRVEKDPNCELQNEECQNTIHLKQITERPFHTF